MVSKLSDAKIPLARPSLGDAESAAADRALRSGRVVLGPENLGFEAALAEACHREHAVAVSSGSTALELGFWASHLSAGDEVLIPAFAFPAAAHAVLRMGAKPIAVDVTAETWEIDLDCAEALRTDKAKLVLSIDPLGFVGNTLAVESFAATHALGVVNDAACGLGGVGVDGRVGAQGGRLATLSFHARKVVTTGEGGAIVTDDEVLAKKLRALRNHGQSRSGHFAFAGTNARLGEMAAAMGRAQMARLPAMLAERRLLAEGYRQRLAKLRESGRISWQESTTAMHAFQSFAVLLDASCDRDSVVTRLAAKGIESGPSTYSFHRLPHLQESRRCELPVADALHDRALSLPMYIGMRAGELDRVCDALEESVGA